jgi:ribosomal protein S18 acetylase RimI-like enzyme
MVLDVRAGISDADLPAVAAVLSDAFAEYPVKLTFTPETLRTMFAAEDVVPDACRLALAADGRLVGAGLACLRDDRGRVSAMGVARGAHRTGVGRTIGEAVLASLKDAGAREVVLEALTVNAPALALYEGPLGFTRRRRLVGFVRSEGGRPISPAQWDQVLSVSGGEPDSWQLRQVIRAVREQDDVRSVPPVVPERHAIADLLRDAGFQHHEVAQYELGRSLR